MSTHQAPITFYNRYTRALETEKVMGERAMQWVYGTWSGNVALHLLLKRAFFSRLLGAMKNSRRSARSIPAFVEEYGIRMEDYVVPEGGFSSFNDFFYRRLKPGARPICAGEDTIAAPADARHSAWQDVSQTEGVFIKGQAFDLPALLGDAELAERYAHGTLLLSRLCPVDYHRYHFPVAGTPEPAIRIPGPLASVSPYCLRHRLSWLWTNKRELTILRTPNLGDVLILAVGAVGVGAIHQTYTPHSPVAKGDEMGYFAFGGSTVITLFEPNRITISPDLAQNSSRCTETFIRQGDEVGRIIA